MLAALIALLLGGAAFALGGGGSTSESSEPLSASEDEVTPSASARQSDDSAGGGVPSAGDVPDMPDSAYRLDWNGLSPEEQLMAELVNRARMDVSEESQLQGEGLASGIPNQDQAPLAVVHNLSDAARDHSQDMDDRQFFDHTNPDGDEPWDRAVDAGHGTTFVGENIAVIASFSTNFDEQARVEDLHTGLWKSDGHQENMLYAPWSEIGVGYDYGSYGGYNGGTYVTTKFSDTGETYLTGVVIDDTDGDEFYDIGEGQGGVRITAIDQDDNVYTTSTWDSGGYTLALPAGTYRVVFEGGDLDSPQEANVTIGSENVKLDIIEDGGDARVFASAMLVPDTEDTSLEDVLPMLPEDEDAMLVQDFEEDALEPVLL